MDLGYLVDEMGGGFAWFMMIVALALAINHVFERTRGSRLASVGTGVVAFSAPALLLGYGGKLGTAGVVALVGALVALGSGLFVRQRQGSGPSSGPSQA